MGIAVDNENSGDTDSEDDDTAAAALLILQITQDMALEERSRAEGFGSIIDAATAPRAAEPEDPWCTTCQEDAVRCPLGDTPSVVTRGP